MADGYIYLVLLCLLILYSCILNNGILQVDIFAQLQNASEAFRTYIRDGLAQVCSRIILIRNKDVWFCTHQLSAADGKERCCRKDAF